MNGYATEYSIDKNSTIRGGGRKPTKLQKVDGHWIASWRSGKYERFYFVSAKRMMIEHFSSTANFERDADALPGFAKRK